MAFPCCGHTLNRPFNKVDRKPEVGESQPPSATIDQVEMAELFSLYFHSLYFYLHLYYSLMTPFVNYVHERDILDPRREEVLYSVLRKSILGHNFILLIFLVSKNQQFNENRFNKKLNKKPLPRKLLRCLVYLPCFLLFLHYRYGGGTFGHTMFNLPDVEVGNLITNMSVSGFGVRRNAKVWYFCLPVRLST